MAIKNSKCVQRFTPMDKQALLDLGQLWLQRAKDGLHEPSNEWDDGGKAAFRRAQNLNEALIVLTERGHETMYDVLTSSVFFRSNSKLYRYSPATHKWAILGRGPWYRSKGILDVLSKCQDKGLVRDIKRSGYEFNTERLPNETAKEYFDRLTRFQETKGFKNGWVGHKFRDIFGDWPSDYFAKQKPQQIAKVLQFRRK